MDIVLLERVENLGQLGDVVKVKSGYARNFLLPQHKALRATKSNLEYFEKQKADLKAQNEKRRAEAETASKKIDGLTLVVIRQASEGAQLYGSVAARDVAEAIVAAGHKAERRQVVLNEPIKTLGIFTVKVALHPEVTVEVKVNVARSAEEAKIQQERGTAVVHATAAEEEAAEAAAAAKAQAEAMFDQTVEQPDVAL
jgi:large subunit ribosomal protein L9